MIGTSPRRVADQRFVTGRGRYLDDLHRPDALHLGVVRSAWAHARLRKVTLDATRALPGVIAAWSAADLEGLAVTLPTVYGGSTKGRPWAIPVLARDVARYVGEPVAVVVADDPYRLADALERVVVEADPLPAIASASAAQQSKTTLHEGWTDNAAITVQGGVGDPSKALDGADLVVRERLAHARLAGVPLETRGVVAYPEGETLVVWSSTQSPYSLRDIVASAIGMPAEQVRVLIPDVGGGFGPKGAIYPEEVLVAGAARRLGRAVKWVESRRESFLAMGHDREQQHDVRVGFRRDGTIAGVDASFVADVGAYPAQGDGLTANTVNHLCAPYRVRDYRNTGTSLVTTKMFNAAYRAAGRPEATFVMERLVDIGARKLGLDPVDVRRRNLIRADEMPYKPGLIYKDGVPINYDPGDFPAAFERMLARFGYEDWRKRQAAERSRARRLGIGVACYLQGTGLGPFESATVRVDPSGKVYVYIGVVAQGQGHATTLAQVAAAELGVAAVPGPVERGPPAARAGRRRHRRGRRHVAGAVRHGDGRKSRGRERGTGGGANRARGSCESRPGGGRDAGVCAGRRSRGGRARARRGPADEVAADRQGRARRHQVEGAQAAGRARAQRVRVLLPGDGHVGVRRQRSRRRSRRRDVRGARAPLRRHA